jgi:hypothetical protein
MAVRRMDNVGIVQQYEYKIALQLWHPSIEPDVVSRSLGLESQVSWRAGEAAETPAGTPLGFDRKQSYWYGGVEALSWRSSDEVPAERQLETLIAHLAPRRDFLQQFGREGGRAIVGISLHGCGNYGLVFSPDTLRKCAELGLSLATDIYEARQHG